MSISTAEFLSALFGEAEGFINFRIIGPSGKTVQEFVPLPALLPNWDDIFKKLLKVNQKGAHIFFGVNPRTEKDGGARSIKACHTLWADLDYDEATLRKNAAPLKSLGLQPSLLLHTGNGYHCYWLLKEPVSPVEAEPVVKLLAHVLGGDHVWDSPRILRIPGTMNTKDPKKFKPCHILRANVEKRFNLLDFEPLTALSPGENPKKEISAAASTLKKEIPTNGHAFAHIVARKMAEYWDEGKRHQVAVALAGKLREAEATEKDAAAIIQRITEITKDSELDDRLKAVRTTYQKAEGEYSGTGILMECFPEDRLKVFFRDFDYICRYIPSPPVKVAGMPRFDLYKCIPPGSLFDLHVQYAAERTDAPLQYHAAAIVTIAAAALGNDVWVQYHGKKMFPTMYTLLVGASSRYRKSTSSTLAVGHASETIAKEYPGNATIEALYTELAPDESKWKEEERKGREPKKVPIEWTGRPSGFIHYPEFGAFLDTTKKNYMADLRMMFTSWYDGIAGKVANSKKTKTSGSYIIEDPAVSILGCVTNESIKKFTSESDMSTGFLSRFFIVMPDQNHENRFDGPRPDQLNGMDTMSEISARLIRLSGSGAPLFITPEAWEIKIEFAKKLHRKMKDFEGSDKGMLDPFLARLEAMATKIAMVYGCEARFPNGSVEANDMKYAVAFCDYSASLLECFYESVAPILGNREAGYKIKVLGLMRRYAQRYGKETPIPHRTLLQNSNLDAEQFRRAVATLREETRLVEPPRTGKRSKYYRLNEK